MRSALSLVRGSALAAACLTLATSAYAQTVCPQSEISFVFVDNHSIFDPDDAGDGERLQWGHRGANALHYRTRADFIRSELLFEVGDCYDEALLEESERVLRAYPFISSADIYGIRQADRRWHVLVDTKDEWTTKLGIQISLPEAPHLRGLALSEDNLLGRGIRARVFLREQDERRDLGAEFFTPRVLGTRADLRLSAGRTRIGTFFEQGLFYPFVGEVGRLAARQVYARRTEFFPFSLGVRRPAGSLTHLLLPFDDERMEVTLAARLGSAGNLTTFGLGVSRETLAFPDFPDGVEVAREGNFGDREAASPELVESVRGSARSTSSTRLNVLMGQRNIRFESRAGLDALRGTQDVAVGTDAALTLGRSARAISAADGAQDDLNVRLRLFLGEARGPVVLASALSLDGRQIFGGEAVNGGWRDLFGEADLLLYVRPQSLASHTFFVRAEGTGGWRVDRPFQLLLGGPTGVRGYREWDFPAARRLVLGVEDRFYVGWPAPDLVDLGFTLFADAGRGWAGLVPSGVDSGWKGAVGAGLRIGFPAGSQRVVRLDVAFPIGPDTSPGDWVIRMSLGDLLGLAAGLENRQLARSRRATVGPDVFTRSR
jgi:hypothetical protein